MTHDAAPRPVGVCSWTFGPLPLDDVLGRIARLGFDGVELFGDLSGPGAAEIRSMLDDTGLKALSLTPADVDIAHPDATVRQRAVDYHHRLSRHAADLGCPIVGCHGLVSRVRPIGTMTEEAEVLVESVRQICRTAAEAGVTVAFEVLNRYESCHVNTAAEARVLLDRVGAPNLSMLLDSYHMNIEEAAPARALEQAGPDLGLYHVADSNRMGLGSGHIDFVAQFSALREIAYDGPIVVECTAAGPDPFTPVKGRGYVDELERHLATSLERIREYSR